MNSNHHTESPVRRLACCYGIALEWTDIWGNTHPVTDETCLALLHAMNVSFDNSNVDAAIAEYTDRHLKRWIEPVFVVPQHRLPVTITFNMREAEQGKTFSWQLVEESGTAHGGEVRPDTLQHLETRELSNGEKIQRYAFNFSMDLPLGYHTFRLSQGDQSRTMQLIITPGECFHPQSLTENERLWGPAIQLYSIKSLRNWGIGDFTDLSNLVDWCATQQAGLIGLNPLHALFPHNPAHCSPYSPSSRTFFNTMYLDVEAVPDFAESETARHMVFSPEFQAALEELRAAEYVDYPAVGKRKMDVLELLYQSFRQNHLDKHTPRAREFRNFLREGGEYLERFALYHALQERFHREDAMIWGWPVWPEAYRDPSSEAVQEFAESNRERIEFYQYLQWQTDEQLHRAGVKSLKRHLPVGLYMDLAVGVDSGGADMWANQHLFAKKCGVGAPPDEYNQMGQDWGLPPLIPEQMHEEAYASFIQILRHNMKYAGALRLDHVMGLMRLFWIPPGMPPSQGAYVHYPLDDLFGILALESQRAHCLIIGEDMGTVPPEIQERMAKWGVLSYKVFYFEKEGEGKFKKPEQYQNTALVAVSTHDLPTLSGFWQGQDIQVRTDLNLYPSKELRERQVRDRVMERVGILTLLDERGLLPEGVTTDPASVPVMTPELSTAIHRLVAQTVCKIHMIQFEDVLQQVDQVNLPGTTEPQYPNWKRKITLPIEELFKDTRMQAIVEALQAERPQRHFYEDEKKKTLNVSAR